MKENQSRDRDEQIKYFLNIWNTEVVPGEGWKVVLATEVEYLSDLVRQVEALIPLFNVHKDCVEAWQLQRASYEEMIQRLSSNHDILAPQVEELKKIALRELRARNYDVDELQNRLIRN